MIPVVEPTPMNVASPIELPWSSGGNGVGVGVGGTAVGVGVGVGTGVAVAVGVGVRVDVGTGVGVGVGVGAGVGEVGAGVTGMLPQSADRTGLHWSPSVSYCTMKPSADAT